MPEVPANKTDPAVGVNQDGVPPPPDTNARPLVAEAANTSNESESLQIIPPFESVKFLFVPPLAIGSTPDTSLVKLTHPEQERSEAVPVRLPVTFPNIVPSTSKTS